MMETVLTTPIQEIFCQNLITGSVRAQVKLLALTMKPISRVFRAGYLTIQIDGEKDI